MELLKMRSFLGRSFYLLVLELLESEGKDAGDHAYTGMEILFKWGGKFNVTGQFGQALFNVR